MVVAAATGATVTAAAVAEVAADAGVARAAVAVVRVDLAVRALAAVQAAGVGPDPVVVVAVLEAAGAVPAGRVAAAVDVVVRGQADPAEGRADALSKACQAP
jgi:hypothetical protein